MMPWWLGNPTVAEHHGASVGGIIELAARGSFQQAMVDDTVDDDQMMVNDG